MYSFQSSDLIFLNKVIGIQGPYFNCTM